MGIRVGIDLGTTFSVVARINEQTGKPEIIKNSFGKTITPSVLCFQENGNILFGEDAKNMQAAGDMNSVAFFKRSMGKDMFSVEFFGKNYSATSLSAILLEKLKIEAEEQIGEKIDSAVITVPAYFTHKERQATIEAGEKAGLEVIAIINEPTAAALAYGLSEKRGEQTVLIYDLGGGTFDVTLAKINSDEINIIGSDGNHELGGKDWDDCIARYLVQEFNEQYGIDISEDSRMVASLLVTAENVKKQLTSMDEVIVPISYKNIKGTIKITEELFESISQFLIGTTKDVTERLLDSINMSWESITGIILVGGSTRMRMVNSYVTEMSHKEPLSGVNVDEAVALGAAIRANIDDKGNVVPLLGGKSNKNKCEGLLIQGAKAISDVTAHALGMVSISTNGERYVNSVIIGKNTKIPAENKRSFNFRTRERDNELEIYVLQGEFQRPLDNAIINKYVVTNIEKTQTIPSLIDVCYRYTANGVVEVTAIQKDIDKKLPIRIEAVPDDMSWTDGSPKDHEEAIVETVEVILAIDLSGSMCGNPIKKAKQAMSDFVNKMDASNTKIGIVAFASKVTTLLKPTDDFKIVQEIISKLEDVKVGYGNEAEPFTEAYSILQGKLIGKSSDIQYIIVLTDGQWNDPHEAIRTAKKCHKAGIEVMAIGFGYADYEFLRQIASTDSFASITDLSGLTGSFSKIAQAIGENSKNIKFM